MLSLPFRMKQFVLERDQVKSFAHRRPGIGIHAVVKQFVSTAIVVVAIYMRAT